MHMLRACLAVALAACCNFNAVTGYTTPAQGASNTQLVVYWKPSESALMLANVKASLPELNLGTQSRPLSSSVMRWSRWAPTGDELWIRGIAQQLQQQAT